mmetsp:Transcript_12870/g.28174  ORF Transcript_12870/g.28174 Transcript_12870/m.28174 type:complete len:217 (-) Transcript_12870:703-1353(-)
MAWARCCRTGRTTSKSGAGRPRTKLEKVQARFRLKVSFPLSIEALMSQSFSTQPMESMTSRISAQSPATLPMPQTACSTTCSLCDDKASTKAAAPPASTRALVCSLVPEAIFVRDQRASKRISRLVSLLQSSTVIGRSPALMQSATGGSRSMLSNFRKRTMPSSLTLSSGNSSHSAIIAIFSGMVMVSESGGRCLSIATASTGSSDSCRASMSLSC